MVNVMEAKEVQQAVRPKQQVVRALLTKGENLVVGTFGSLIASTLQMPLLTWKYCSQRGVPLPEAWGGMYQGLRPRLVAVIPLNVTTIVANGILEKLLGATDSKPLTRMQKLLCAFLAGCISSPIQSLMDTSIVHQQRLNLGLTDTWQTIFNEYGMHALTHGMIPTAARESIGAIGFLLLTPIFAELIAKRLNIGSSSFFSKIATSFLGSFPAAFVSSFITMPLDAAKTKSVVDIGLVAYKSTWHAIADTYQKHGLRALFAGFPQRTLVLVITMFILPLVRELAISYKTQSQYSSVYDDKRVSAHEKASEPVQGVEQKSKRPRLLIVGALLALLIAYFVAIVAPRLHA